MLSAEQNHKVDASVHYNIPELQSSSRLPLPQHNGQQEPPAGRKGPLAQEMDPDSEEEEEDGEEEEEEPPRRKWHGIEAIFEAYQEHVEGRQGREAGRAPTTKGSFVVPECTASIGTVSKGWHEALPMSGRAGSCYTGPRMYKSGPLRRASLSRAWSPPEPS